MLTTLLRLPLPPHTVFKTQLLSELWVGTEGLKFLRPFEKLGRK